MQPYDPYAPPAAAPLTARVASPLFAGAPQAWTVGEVIGLAWERFKATPVPLVLATLVYFVISEAVGNIPTVLELTRVIDPQSAAAHPVNLAFALVNFSVGSWLQVGMTRMWLDCARGNPVRFADMFGGADRMLAMAGSQFVFGLAVGLAFVACILPIFPVAAGLCLSPFFVVDAQMRGMDALRSSWKATVGQRMPLIGLGLLAFAMWAFGVVLCGVGFLVAYPLSYVALAIVYLRITGGDRSATPAAMPYAPAPPAG